MKTNITTNFTKRDIVPYVIGVQFRWQFDPNSELYQETKRTNAESLWSIHLIDDEGAIVDPMSGTVLSYLDELDDDLHYVGISYIKQDSYGNDDFDIVKAFNLAQTLTCDCREPILIYDRVDDSK